MNRASTTNEMRKNNLILLLRQVDDFLIAGPDKQSCEEIRAKIQTHMNSFKKYVNKSEIWSRARINLTDLYDILLSALERC